MQQNKNLSIFRKNTDKKLRDMDLSVNESSSYLPVSYPLQIPTKLTDIHVDVDFSP